MDWSHLKDGTVLLTESVGYSDDCNPMVVAGRLKTGKLSGKLAMMEAVAGGLLVEVADVSVGPRGGLKWLKPYVKAILTEGDIKAAADSIRAAGFCPECYSAGLTFVSWQKGKGSTYRACRACGGTGKANG